VPATILDRNYSRRLPGDRNFPVAAGENIPAGVGVIIETATGLARNAGTAVGKSVGVSKFRANNTGGIASAISIEVESDYVVAFFSAGGADTITLANVGDDVFWVDNQTLGLTNGGGTRSRAGKCHNVTEAGVWLRFDQ